MKVNAAGDAVKRLVHVKRLLPGAEMDFDVPALAAKPDQFVGGALLYRHIGHEDVPVFTGQCLFARPDAIAFALVLFA